MQVEGAEHCERLQEEEPQVQVRTLVDCVVLVIDGLDAGMSSGTLRVPETCACMALTREPLVSCASRAGLAERPFVCRDNRDAKFSPSAIRRVNQIFTQYNFFVDGAPSLITHIHLLLSFLQVHLPFAQNFLRPEFIGHRAR